MIEALGRSGVKRASIGVQDFDPEVQRAINRRQPYEVTQRAVDGLRAAGIAAINIDLIYGLPHQTVASARATAEQAVAALRPNRVAIFGYAHVPWMKSHQRLLPELALPGTVERLARQAAAAALRWRPGYVRVGLDHFALPEDDMAQAAGAGRLARNFQGYTTDAAPVLIGLGASSIGTLPQGYVQNAAEVKGLGGRSLQSGELADRARHRARATTIACAAMSSSG